MEKMDVIFRQVFIKNLKSKTWLWIVLGPLVLAAIIGAVFWLMNQTNQTTRIGVVSDSPALVQTFKSSSDNDQRYTHYATTAAAKRALAAEKLDAVLTVTGQPDPTGKSHSANRWAKYQSHPTTRCAGSSPHQKSCQSTTAIDHPTAATFCDSRLGHYQCQSR